MCSPSRPVRPRTPASGAPVGALDAARRRRPARAPRRPRRRPSPGRPRRRSAASRASTGWVAQQLGVQRPQLVEAGDQPAPRLLGALGEGEEPAAGVVAVVGQLLDALGRDRGEHRVAAAGQPLEQREPGGGEQQQPGDGVREVAVGDLGQPDVAEVAGLAEEGQRVLGRHRRARRAARARRSGRPPRPGPAAAGPGRAGRARCWPARCPPRGPGARLHHSESRWESTSASSASIRQYVASVGAVDAVRARVVSTPASGSSKSVPNAHWDESVPSRPS